jgi:hypothetical protein
MMADSASPALPVRPAESGFLLLLRRRSRVQQDVTLDADLLDQIKLAVKEVNVFFFVFENVHQQVPGDEVAHSFAVGDSLA